jgi:hypothetical protein
MAFELREIENKVREFVIERLKWHEPFSVARDGLEYLRNEFEKKLGARVSEFGVSTVFTPRDTTRVEGATKLKIKFDVRGQRVECYIDIPIKSAIVSGILRDESYSGTFMITPSEKSPIIRCYTVRE